MANETFSILETARATLPPELLDQFSVVLNLAKISALILIIYFIVMIVQLILRILAEQKNKKNLSKIAENTEKTNAQLDNLIELIKHQHNPKSVK